MTRIGSDAITCWIYQLLRIHIYCSSLLHLVLQNCSVSWTSSSTKSTTLQSTEYLPIDYSNTKGFHSGWIQGWQHARYRIRNTDFSKYIYLNIYMLTKESLSLLMAKVCAIVTLEIMHLLVPRRHWGSDIIIEPKYYNYKQA